MERPNVASPCTETPIHTSNRVRNAPESLQIARRKAPVEKLGGRRTGQPRQTGVTGKQVRLMARKPITDRSPSVYALVATSEPIGSSQTVRVALRQGDETLWSFTETLQAKNPLEPVLLGIWRVAGEASRQRLTKLHLYLEKPEVVDMLERRIPVPGELGKAFLLARSRLNQFYRVRFSPLHQLPSRVHAEPAGVEAQRSLFDVALV
jgi:hypothetical protein